MRKFTVLLRRDLIWHVFYVWAEDAVAANKTARIHYLSGVTVD